MVKGRNEYLVADLMSNKLYKESLGKDYIDIVGQVPQEEFKKGESLISAQYGCSLASSQADMSYLKTKCVKTSWSKLPKEWKDAFIYYMGWE
jgi:hypothetical protein